MSIIASRHLVRQLRAMRLSWQTALVCWRVTAWEVKASFRCSESEVFEYNAVGSLACGVHVEAVLRLSKQKIRTVRVKTTYLPFWPGPSRYRWMHKRAWRWERTEWRGINETPSSRGMCTLAKRLPLAGRALLEEAVAATKAFFTGFLVPFYADSVRRWQCCPRIKV